MAFNITSGRLPGARKIVIYGPEGIGKSTLARVLLRLEEPQSGSILLDGTELTALKGEALRKRRGDFQMIFQDPYASLNPRLSVYSTLEEPLLLHTHLSGEERKERIGELLDMVGLHREHAGRYPHQFSGGQRQRIGIARALAVNPRFIVADEPVSALDVSVQAQIVNLLQDIQKKTGTALCPGRSDEGLLLHGLAVPVGTAGQDDFNFFHSPEVVGVPQGLQQLQPLGEHGAPPVLPGDFVSDGIVGGYQKGDVPVDIEQGILQVPELLFGNDPAPVPDAGAVESPGVRVVIGSRLVHSGGFREENGPDLLDIDADPLKVAPRNLFQLPGGHGEKRSFKYALSIRRTKQAF